MRVCILGFDGLDYEYVTKFKCKHLMQREYGKVDISSMYSTPTIWASFITGLSPKEHGAIETTKDPIVPLISPLRKISIPLILRSTGMFILRKISKTSLGDRRIRRGVKTIFDYAKNPIALWVPSYNPCPKCWSLRFSYMLEKAVSDSKHEKAYMHMIFKHFQEHYRECLKKMIKRKDWDLLMAWFGLADRIGHIFGGRTSIMMKTYNILNNFIPKVKQIIGKSALLLIISDHGIKPYGKWGVHREYAFYSLNIRLGLRNVKITDFYKLIKGLLKV